MNLEILRKTLRPKLNSGEYVFCTIKELKTIDITDVVMIFKEEDGITVIVKKEIADNLKLDYSFVASWITLTIHSSLEAVGLTALFSKALSDNGICCNVVAAYYHDHIFIDRKDAKASMNILLQLSKT